MKKMTKKLGAIVLALAMCFSLCCTAFAASSDDTDFSITITNAAAGQTYTAYKIFDVTYDDNGNYSYTISSTSAWYTFFTTNAALDDYTMPFDFTPSAGDATTYVVTVKTDSTTQEAYTDAEIIGYLNAAIAAIGSPQEQADGTVIWSVPTEYGPAYTTDTPNADGTVTIDVDEAGYYFVTTTNGSVVSITTTHPAATITDKNEGFDLNKEVKTSGLTDGDEESQDSHGDAEAIGDDVEFEVTANVPLYTAVEPDNVKDGKAIASPEGYLVTDYSFEDQMSAGLEIRDLVEDVDYEYTYAWVYDSETGTYTWTQGYFATETLINKWVTISDGTTEYNLTDVAYNVVLQLIPTYYIDENGDEQVQFDGFTLYYDTLPYVMGDDGSRTLYYDGAPVTEYTFQTAPELVEAVGTEYPTNASITIDYTAHVTGEAVYDNTNDITMHWDGTPYRTPNPNEPEYKGSEKDEDDIYVLELDITKVDGSNNNPLAGATFTLEGTNLQDVVTNSSESYEPVTSYEDYAKYKADGIELWFEVYTDDTYTSTTYTNVDPYELDDPDELVKYVINPNYPNIVDDYAYVAYVKEEYHDSTTTPAGDRTVTGTTQYDGTLTFTGLTVGDWTLTEIVAPDGYNLLDSPIKFTISVDEWQLNPETGKYDIPVWSITTEEGSQYTLTVNDENGHIDITIQNNSGTELPGTGGIGTTIFYIIGGILVAGAVVVLVTRRRVNHEA